MITEDYCSYEVAKLLKEKGFHEKVNHVYHYYTSAPFYRRHLRDFNGEDYKNLKHEHYSAPSLAMAMKWLREVHNIIIVVEPYMYNYVDSKTSSYIYSIWCGDNYDCKNEEYNSYEEAAEAGIKHCLENLI